MQAIAAIGALKAEGITAVFSGGTSLAAAWQLIRRFSEDIDFKVDVSAASPSARRKIRSAYRESVIEALKKTGYLLDGAPLIGNESRFFRASFRYEAVFPPTTGIRPYLQVEMSFGGTHLRPVERPVQSLLGRALKAAPEVTSLPCVDPVETAADKLSALAWRTAARSRSDANDDPAIVRHIHDLAALATTAHNADEFPSLTHRLLNIDAKRAGKTDADGVALLRAVLPSIENDPLWKEEYEQFVSAVSFGPDAERISYETAMNALKQITKSVLAEAQQALGTL